MAAELRSAFGIEARLVKGSGGVFDVRVDGKLVFSKHALGRFPEPGEVVGLIRAALQQHDASPSSDRP
ncbi:MAG: SelT/SelW/SelH family protein [Thermoanaerobaculaceae bacterium]|nr:SelT/SelW/SelH family protein [Thermoanaerobaculaceae bacterium]